MDESKLLPIAYLPGGGGSSSFWRPVADRLWRVGAPIVLGYPGFGDVPPRDDINSLDDFYEALLAILPSRFNLVAQSMGNVLALRTAIEHPDRVANLILCAATGGIDVKSLGGEDWRDEPSNMNLAHPKWFIEDATDYADRFSDIRIPTLILSGDTDPLSPPSVGQFLNKSIPSSELQIIPGGTHWMALEQPDQISSLIGHFLGNSAHL